jgi:type I restriction enzyme S subunit
MSDQWRETTLGEQVTLQRGYDITKQTMSDGPIPVISSGGINGYHNVAVAKGPGVLLGRKGSVGSVHYSEGDYWPHDTTLWVKDFHGNLPRFVYRFFNQFPIKRYEASTANPSLNRNNLHPVAVYWPPLAEQKRIAGILDAADALRAKRRESLAQLDSLLQSTFLTLFGDPVANPMGWPMVTIGELLSSTAYGTSRKAHSEERGLPCLRMNNITYSGDWDFSSLKYVDLEAKEIPKCTVAKGQILFNRTNSKELVGKTAVYRRDAPMAFAGYLVRGIPNAEADPDYISAFLNLPQGKAILQGMCKSIVGMANINAQEFKSIQIPKPPLPLQRRLAAIVESVERQKDLQRAHLAELDALFAALQHRAFRGEL